MTEASDAPVPSPLEAAPARSLPWVTISLAVANVAVFVWAVAAGADVLQPTAPWMIEHGGNFGPRTLGGEPWRLFTSMFLHYGVLHIAMNLIGLLDGGRHVERMYGRAGFLALYVVAGLCGSLATSLRSDVVVSAGASGAIFGVFGAFGAFLFLHRDRLDREVVKKQSRGLLIFLAYNIYFGISAQGIDLVAHLGGLAAGFVAGVALELGTSHDRSSPRRSVLVAAVGVALAFGGAMVAPRPVNAVQNLSAVESVVLDRWNTAVGKIKSGELSDAAAADLIEKDLLPPWRDARAAFERDGKGKLRDVMIRYLHAREEGWEVIAQGLRAGEEATVMRGMKRFNEADAMVEEIKAAAR